MGATQLMPLIKASMNRVYNFQLAKYTVTDILVYTSCNMQHDITLNTTKIINLMFLISTDFIWQTYAESKAANYMMSLVF